MGYSAFEKKDMSWEKVPVSNAATADPAAAANPAEVTVPTGKTWLILHMSVTAVTDANAANRYATVAVKDDGTNISRTYVDPAPHVASTTASHEFIPGGSAQTTLRGVNVGSLPAMGLELPAGAKFQLVFTSIQAADDLGPLYYAYKEIAV